MNYSQMGEVFQYLLAHREVSADPIMGRKSTEASRIGKILDNAYMLQQLEGFESFLHAQGFALVDYDPPYFFGKIGTAKTYILARTDVGEADYMNKDWVIENMADRRHPDTRDVRVIWAVQHWLALQQLLYTRHNRAVTEVSRFMEAVVTAQEFTWQELVSLLSGFGYTLAKPGKTGGSRVKFIHETLPPIILHKPHPTPVGIDMKDMMKYKNYYGSVHYSDDDKVFYGKVEFIRALVSYEGTDVKSLRKAFEEAVDDYFQTCKEQDKEPEHSFKGSFNIRVGSSLHQRIALEAMKKGVTLNKYIADVLGKETGKQKIA